MLWISKNSTNEMHKISCESPYALSKYMEKQLHLFEKFIILGEFNKNFQCLWRKDKYKGVYGSVFPVFFKQILENKPITLWVIEQKRLRLCNRCC